MNLKFNTKNPKPRSSNVNPKMGYKGVKKKINFFSRNPAYGSERKEMGSSKIHLFFEIFHKNREREREI